MFATILQLAGLTALIVGGFLISVPAGVIAVAVVCLYVGEAAERGG